MKRQDKLGEIETKRQRRGETGGEGEIDRDMQIEGEKDTERQIERWERVRKTERGREREGERWVEVKCMFQIERS